MPPKIYVILDQETPQEKKQTSHCLLLYGPNISGDATERLEAVWATRDGFLLAERDLFLRGPGEVLGVRQKGYIEGRLVFPRRKSSRVLL